MWLEILFWIVLIGIITFLVIRYTRMYAEGWSLLLLWSMNAPEWLIGVAMALIIAIHIVRR